MLIEDLMHILKESDAGYVCMDLADAVIIVADRQNAKVMLKSVGEEGIECD